VLLDLSVKNALVRTLNRRLLQRYQTSSSDLAEREMRVPADLFFCPQRHMTEIESLFRNTAQAVAFSAEIPDPQTYLALDVVDLPVLLSRDTNGTLHAFINACAHRGARVAEGAGRGSKLVCGFHGWTYSLDGQLVGRPQELCFTTAKQECGLTRLPVLEKFGIVFLGMNPEFSPDKLEVALEGLNDELENYHLEQYRTVERRQFDVDANWKLVTYLSLESYHFNILHRNSVATVLASNAVVDTYNNHSRWAFPFKSIDRLANLDEQDWPNELQGSCTYTLYPGLILIVNASGAQMIRAEPGANAGKSRVVYVGIAPTQIDPNTAEQAYNFGGQVFETEDLPVAQECQLGLEAGQRDLIIGVNEPLLQFWTRIWTEV
jgi:phenylpropionate dioxygenase-like ring-hydroxylating dioxygenase large terminal subunit